MSELEQAHPITCPHCWETIEVWIDLSAGAQRYIEDCPVCCHPMALRFEVDGDQLVALEADVAD